MFVSHDRSSKPDYDRVLESVKPVAIDIGQRLKMGQRLEEGRKILFRYVCEAILLKEHKQTESAVLNFKVVLFAIS